MLVRLRLFEDESCAALHMVWIPSLLAVIAAGTTTATPPFFWCNMVQPVRTFAFQGLDGFEAPTYGGKGGAFVCRR